MKRSRTIPLILAAILVAVQLVGCTSTTPSGASTPPVQQLALGSVPTTSGHYAYFAAISKSINAGVKGVQVSVVESGASVDNLNRIHTKEFDFGLANISTAYEAHNGLNAWKEKPMPNLRFLWTYAISPYVVIAREDSGIKTPQGFAGKDFSPGGVGSSTAVASERVMTALGLNVNFFRGSQGDGANALKNQQVAGFTKISTGLKARDALLMEIQSGTKIRFISFSDEDIKKVKSQFDMYSWLRVPANIYDNQPYEFVTFGDLSGVVATEEMSSELVYEMAKAVFAEKKTQEDAFGALKEIDYIKDTLLGDPYIPLHAGMVKYLKEQGVDVPQKLIPPEYKS